MDQFYRRKVKQQCLVPIDFELYQNKLWYNVITIDVGQIILGRSWLYDKAVTSHGRSDMCRFEH